jgi:transcriptional regulator with XRE-family HTH domain
MNLTQKQLASLAKVSTPTISRFEQAAKDIQLSTVLAVLEVLGMSDKRTLVFDPEHKFDLDDSAVFWGNDDKTRVRVRIERDALDDHFSDHGRLRFKAAFEKHRPEIEALARRKYILGHREADGSVFIRTGDIA